MECNPIPDGRFVTCTELRDSIASFRRATVLLAAERSGLKGFLDQHELLPADLVDSTSMRLLRAGTILGVFQHPDDGMYSWSPKYQWVRTQPDRWKQLIAMIRHQLSYLNLVDSPAFWREGQHSPADQLSADPQGYKAFLLGVAASHQYHAQWLSSLSYLESCRSMADVGGGLGTYAEAWVASSKERSAVIIDLPGVEQFVADLIIRCGSQLGFIGADLNQPFAVSGPTIDFILFANVLHLVPDWRTVLGRVVRSARDGCRVGIFEADPSTPQGTLFDLQVHLRSGRVTGLLHAASIAASVAASGIRNIQHFTTIDPDDPFERHYGLWIGEVEQLSRPEGMCD